MKNQNIVMLCQQGWDTAVDSNARNLAFELAKQNNVLYVSMPLDVNTVLKRYREPAIRERLRGLVSRPAPRQFGERLWVHAPNVLGLSINWLKSKRVFRLLNRLNSRLLARSIRRAARAVGFSSYYLFQDGLIYQGLELPRLLKPKGFYYYLRDYMIAVPYFQQHGAWVEQRLMQSADAVLTNSAYLNDYAHQFTPRSYDIGQGCVLTRYQAEVSYPEPADMAPIAHPRIVYTGYLTALRLDLDLLLTLARERPDWHLVLVGPEDDAFAASELHRLPNVHFLGNKKPEQLAAYLQHADVCINPQLINEITIGNYPLKIDEYLAMGKPIVASHTRAMEMFGAHVYLAANAADWLHLLQEALATDGPSTSAARIAFAQGHTWQASVAAFYRAVATTEQAALAPSHAS